MATLKVNKANAPFNGTDDDDILLGDSRDNLMLAGDGAGGDNLDGGAGEDRIDGGADEDIIRGDAGDDEIDGESGSDTLLGGAGQDTILGGAGSDVFLGDDRDDGAAADVLTGGSDADHFVFVNVAKAIKDTIADFDAFGSDRDVIDLSHILDTKSTFTGGSVQEVAIQGYLYAVKNRAGGTTVMIDLSGGLDHNDAKNNFAVVDLEGVSLTSLTVEHFIV